jgi:hypothetical protein
MHVDDDLDLFYKKANGALITQIVGYGDLYIYIYQLKEIEKEIINDSEFILPKGIKIVEEKRNKFKLTHYYKP